MTPVLPGCSIPGTVSSSYGLDCEAPRKWHADEILPDPLSGGDLWAGDHELDDKSARIDESDHGLRA
jgi:hypothetical protein